MNEVVIFKLENLDQCYPPFPQNGGSFSEEEMFNYPQYL